MPTPAALTDAQAEEAALLYSHLDWPRSDIAEHFGVSETAVRNALARLKAPKHQPPPLRMRQCSQCLQFLPVSMFYVLRQTQRKTRYESACRSCKEHHTPAPIYTPAPLVQAISAWRVVQ